VAIATIGSELTLLGDTVNVAARLERMTRELHVDVVLSEQVVAQLAALGHAAGIEDLGWREVAGRRRMEHLYGLTLG
jgi:class 3 adenylate cyclase